MALLRESEEWEISVGGSLRLLIKVSNRKRIRLASPSPRLWVARRRRRDAGKHVRLAGWLTGWSSDAARYIRRCMLPYPIDRLRTTDHTLAYQKCLY